jgi:hypothetical protein
MSGKGDEEPVFCTSKILSIIFLSRLTHTETKLLGVVSVNFDILDQLLIFSIFVVFQRECEYCGHNTVRCRLQESL